MPSSTTKLHVVRREVAEGVANEIRKALEHARAARVLASYDGACVYDGREILIMLSPDAMHPAERANFGVERAVLDLLVERAATDHRIT